jgi:hypothetical protein
MAGFKVFTLVVVPGMAVCVEETDPLPAGLPESGSAFAFCAKALLPETVRITAKQNGA